MLARKSESEKILIFTHTINQIDPYIHEWRKLVDHLNRQSAPNNKSPKRRSPVIIPLLGKKIICNCRVGHKSKKIGKSKLRKILKEFNFALFNTTTDIITFFSQFASHRKCVYDLIIQFLPHSDIIITTMGYFNHHELLLNRLKINPRDLLVIIDEAHNLHKISTLKISLDDVIFCLNHIGNHPFLTELYTLMLETRGELSDQVIENVEKWRTNYLQTLAEIQKGDIADVITDNKLFLDDRYVKLKDFAQTKLGSSVNYIMGSELVCVGLLPSQKLAIFEAATKIILQSGTILDPSNFKKLIGISTDSQSLIIPSVYENNIFKGVFLNFTTSHENRTRSSFRQVTIFITQLVRLNPRHILLMCPSYKYIELLYPYLKQKLKLPLLQETAASSAKMMISNVLKMKSQVVILGNQRGKILEGNEWVLNEHSLISSVVLVGLSYPAQSTEEKLVRRILRNELGSNFLAQYYSLHFPILSRVLQSWGRAVRSKKDKGALIILENRSLEFLTRHINTRTYANFSNLCQDVKHFFEGYPSLDTVLRM